MKIRSATRAVPGKVRLRSGRSHACIVGGRRGARLCVAEVQASSDFWHVLFGLPPTVHGELVLKWFELVHTGLPVAAFSALFGPLRLSAKQRKAAVRCTCPLGYPSGQGMHAVYVSSLLRAVF